MSAGLTPDSPSPVTPALTIRGCICAYIRTGAFPHVAAEAAGLHADTFENWMEQGRADPDGSFGSFYTAVSAANAHARLRAEQAVFKDKPELWLRTGPGRDAERPGWSSPPRPIVRTTRTQINILESPEWMALLARILAALAPFPDARAAAAAALADSTTPTLIPARPATPETHDPTV